jgi:hypothetical protein
MAKKKVVAPAVSAEVVAQIEVIDGEVVEVVGQTTQPSVLSQLAAVPEVEAEVKVDKNEGVGQFIRNLIGDGLGNKAILDIVHEQYGNKNTTYACVAWYRNKMKKAGTDVKKASNADWVQNFAKSNGLSEDAVQELSQKVA